MVKQIQIYESLSTGILLELCAPKTIIRKTKPIHLLPLVKIVISTVQVKGFEDWYLQTTALPTPQLQPKIRKNKKLEDQKDFSYSTWNMMFGRVIYLQYKTSRVIGNSTHNIQPSRCSCHKNVFLHQSMFMEKIKITYVSLISIQRRKDNSLVSTGVTNDLDNYTYKQKTNIIVIQISLP